jgi:hypothetical protein
MQQTSAQTQRFQARPVVIEAEQYFPWRKEPAGVCFCHIQQHRMAHVHPLEGLELVESGDWIVTTKGGSRFPVKQDVFAATYEPAT